MPAPTELQAKQANAVYDVLVRLGRAPDSESNRSQFAYFYADRGSGPSGGADEYRFGGALGSGGKIWWSRSQGWSVSCYQENENAARRKIIEALTVALSKFNTDEQNMRRIRGW